MLWNWYTIDSCFLAQSWHVHTHAQFAGTCIFVFALVLALEFVRRAQREYDRHIVRKWQASVAGAETAAAKSEDGEAALGLRTGFLTPLTFRPTLLQQAVRCAFYAAQFGAAYLTMLLAMYYNGYILLSILLGAFVGHFLFGYDNIMIGGKQETGTSCC
ncbi:Ctr copper transporter [Wilcoxina mikolae CBS 423.85]|nr:Ctr copper transporter [Wilcoxina mikolae CBS 423.85]